MDFKIITAVTTEPVVLAEARLQCKVDPDDTSHDSHLENVLIPGAREFAENATGSALAPRTLEAAFDAFPACGEAIVLPMPPVTAITSIKYTDLAGAEQTLGADQYTLNSYGDSRQVTLAFGASWPATRCVPNAVRVRFECGYGKEDGPGLPQAAKAAMLIHVELDSPINPHTPQERAAMEAARDSLLNTLKVYGH